MTANSITQNDIKSTESLIRPHIRQTPVIEVNSADFGIGDNSVTVKLEMMQHGGSFKCRGAFANLLTREIPPAGVVAASGGNHGVAVAYGAMKLGILAKIFVPNISSPTKIERIRRLGADLELSGELYADALAASEQWLDQTGALSVHAFDQRETILGQGTLGTELEGQAPDIDTVLVSVGGGGLIAGVAAWYANRTKVVGVEPEASPTLFAALEAGAPVDAPAGGVAADSLAPRRVGENVFPIAQRFVDHVALVSDDAIRTAQVALWDELRVVAEPGGVTAFTALHCGAYQPQAGERVGVVISGGNTTAVDFS